MLLVSQDRGGAEKVNPVFANMKLKALTTDLDPKDALTEAFAVRGLPTSILIGRDGQVLGRVEGEANWDGEPAQAMIRSYLAQE